ncbi:MAG: hypothetical protein AB1779_09040 [Candidatus Thermoplasmatota archaeon]
MQEVELSLNNPEVAVEIISGLYYGSMRASSIVEEVMKATGVSEPTVYGVLRELQYKKLIEKLERSKRNVIYRLTERGYKLLEKEHFTIIDNMLSTIKNPKRRKEVMIELLLDDVMSELPKELQTPEAKEKLRKGMLAEIDDIKKRIVRFASAIIL